MTGAQLSYLTRLVADARKAGLSIGQIKVVVISAVPFINYPPILGADLQNFLNAIK